MEIIGIKQDFFADSWQLAFEKLRDEGRTMLQVRFVSHYKRCRSYTTLKGKVRPQLEGLTGIFLLCSRQKKDGIKATCYEMVCFYCDKRVCVYPCGDVKKADRKRYGMKHWMSIGTVFNNWENRSFWVKVKKQPKKIFLTVTDQVTTKKESAKWIIDHFLPANSTGTILDSAAGSNAFYDQYPVGMIKNRCEITENIDFMAWDKPVDWIITCPPTSTFEGFLRKSTQIATNVVYLLPFSKLFNSNKVINNIMNWGGIKEIIFMGPGRWHGYPYGFPIMCIHYQKDYKGDAKINYFDKLLSDLPSKNEGEI